MSQDLFPQSWLVNTLLDEGFIGPLLTQLGWTSVTQQTITVQGKLAKPDWCLLLEAGQDNALIASKDHPLITAMATKRPEYLALLQ